MLDTNAAPQPEPTPHMLQTPAGTIRITEREALLRLELEAVRGQLNRALADAAALEAQCTLLRGRLEGASGELAGLKQAQAKDRIAAAEQTIADKVAGDIVADTASDTDKAAEAAIAKLRRH